MLRSNFLLWGPTLSLFCLVVRDTSGSPSTFIGETPRDLTLADALALERLSTVKFQAPVVIGESGITHKGLERRVPVIGTTTSLLTIRHLKLGPVTLSSGDPRQSRPVCMLGAKVRQELFGTEPAVGRLVGLVNIAAGLSGCWPPRGVL